MVLTQTLLSHIFEVTKVYINLLTVFLTVAGLNHRIYGYHYDSSGELMNVLLSSLYVLTVVPFYIYIN